MATVTDVRHANLQMLIDWAGSTQALADLLDRSHSQLSQLRNQVAHSKTGKPRTMGNALAREIEAVLGKPEGWMDSPQGRPALTLSELLNFKKHGIPPQTHSANMPLYSQRSPTDPSPAEWIATARRLAETWNPSDRSPAEAAGERAFLLAFLAKVDAAALQVR